MRVWVQSSGSSNIYVCEFKLEFLSYKKKNNKSWLYISYINLVLDFSILSLLSGDFIFIFSCFDPKDEMRVSSFIVDLYIVLIKKA